MVNLRSDTELDPSVFCEFLHKKHIDIKFKKNVYIVLMFLKKLQ